MESATLMLYVLLFLFLVVYVLALVDRVFGGEDFATSDAALNAIGEVINSSPHAKGLLLDLGSCRGYFVFGIRTHCPDIQIEGIDNSVVRVLYSRLKEFFYRNRVTFIFGDIYKTDTTRADIVYVYVPREMLPTIEKKLQSELRPGSLVITYRINFPTWLPQKIIITDQSQPQEEKVFVYRMQ